MLRRALRVTRTDNCCPYPRLFRSHTAIELALGVAAGVAVGAASSWMLVAARRAGWSAPIGERIGLLAVAVVAWARSEEHTSELQSLMSNSYAVFCLKKKTPH